MNPEEEPLNPEEPHSATWETFNHLAQAVTDATTKVTQDREKNEERIAASVRKMRWFRRAAVLAVFAAALSLWSSREANILSNKLQDQRDEARIVQCQRDNENTGRINALNDRTQQLVRRAVEEGSSNRTPDQQAIAEAFLSSELQKFEEVKVPLRDCSPEGIEAFYSE